jgi:beta-galactosidase
LATLVLSTLAVAPASAWAEAVAPRLVQPLADGWKFVQDDAVQGAQSPGFDDAGWGAVSVPHTWNRVGYYLAGEHPSLNTPDTVNLKRGVGWYRLTFTPSPALADKRVWLQFDAASATAEVWLNGQKLGEHKGGFSRFRLDATAALVPGAPNLLVVRTDNSTPKPGGPTADVLPLSGDFFVHGGLYRPVSLIATAPVHIDMLDAGGPGVYATTTAIADHRAVVAVRARVANDTDQATPVVVVAALRDAKGKVAAQASASVLLAPGQPTEVSRDLALKAPRLWQGVQDPYLYTLSVEIRSPSGAVLDRLDQPFGVRQIHIDPDQGLWLNGRRLALHGVGLHQDRDGKGWATSPADTEADLALIREMGANTVRLTHYQHGQTIHDLADRYGLILWDEIPLVSRWTLRPDQAEATEGLVAGAREELIELIRQNYNHASVAVWGVANEVDFGALPAIFAGGSDGRQPDPSALLKTLNAVARREDPARPTTLATCCEHKPPVPGTTPPIVADLTEVSAANRYFGWYYDEVEDLGPHLDGLHAARPRQPQAVSEYGAGGALTQHSDNALGGPVAFYGRPQPEEYQSFVHERSWPILKARPYLWATWAWTMFDYATNIRQEGDGADLNTKGLVAYDHKTRKDAFWFYKANWSSQPVVHITSARYRDRAYAVNDVRVYSNAARTELLLNGVSQGIRTDCPDRICVWPAVALKPGVNVLTGRGRFTSGAVQDQATWTLSPAQAAAVRIDSGALVAAPSQAGRFGSDAFFIGGRAANVTPPPRMGPPQKPPVIAGNPDQALLSSYRAGAFRYRVPVAKGTRQVRLWFVEPDQPAGARSFDVLVNGQRVLQGLDVAAIAGGPLKAVERSFPATARDGVIDLEFRPGVGDAIVSAIEITP